MQLAVRFAATLSGITWITSVAQAARRAVEQKPTKGGDLIKLGSNAHSAIWPLRIPSEIGKAVIDQAHEHKLRAIAHIFYLNSARPRFRNGRMRSRIARAISPLIRHCDSCSLAR